MPKLEEYILKKEEWSPNMWDDIALRSFKIAFNKIPTARQPITDAAKE
jgi:hypothetical protein